MRKSCVSFDEQGGWTLDTRGLRPVTPSRAYALVWLARCGKYRFRQLVMTGQSEFCSQVLDPENFECFMTFEAFEPLRSVDLDNCGFTSVPKIEHLLFLEKIDISNNEIYSLPPFKHNTLRKLQIDGNPIQTVDFDPEDFPNLEILSLGSEQTQIIGGRLIELSVKKKSFSLQVSNKHRASLTVPLLSSGYTAQVNPRSSAPQSTEVSLLSTPEVPGTPRSGRRSVSSSFSRLSRFALRRSASQSILSASSESASVASSSSPRSITGGSLRRRFSLPGKQTPSSAGVSLSSLRALVQNTLDLSNYFNRVKESLDFGRIPDVQDRHKACVYVLENVHLAKSLHKLKLSGQADFCAWLQPEGLSEFLQHPGLRDLHTLDLSCCGLEALPDMTALVKLRSLDLTGNNISAIGEGIQKLNVLTKLTLDKNPLAEIGEHVKACKTLEELRIRDTNIEKIHIDFAHGELPLLDYMDCGSRRLRFVSHATLRRVVASTRPLTILVEPEHRAALTVPTHDTLTAPAALHHFLSHQDLTDLIEGNLKGEEFFAATMFLLDQPEQTFRTADFSGRQMEPQHVQRIAHHARAASLTSLTLSHLGLESVPDISGLTSLSTLDLSNNALRTLETLTNSSISVLNVTENQFEVLDVCPDKLPALSEVSFGSAKCRYVTYPILKKVAGGLRARLHERHTDALLVPPPPLLDDRRALKVYLKSTELSLDKLNRSKADARELYDAMVWMRENFCVSYESLNLENESTFCKSVGTELLESLINKIPALTRLVLSNCNLPTAPNLRDCAELRIVNMKGNNVASLSLVSSDILTDLDLEGNPVPGVDMAQASLPSLKRLRVGSAQTKYFSLATLERKKEGSLILEVAPAHLHHVVFPTPECLEDEAALAEFIERAELNLSAMKGGERQAAADWVLRRSGPELRSLVLSDLRKDDASTAADLKGILATVDGDLKNLKRLEKLNMSNLGLKSFPGVSVLTSLKTLDLSGNQITSIDVTEANDTLAELNVKLNPIETLDTALPQFKSLTTLGIGSHELTLICHPLLTRIASGLTAEVDTSCRASLLYPPHDVVSDAEKLGAFVEKRKLTLSHVPDDEKASVLLWLTSKCNVQFRVLNLDGEKELFNDERLAWEEYFAPAKCFEELEELVLSSCGLEHTPNLSRFTRLQNVDLSENSIEQVDEKKLPVSLRILSVQGNPVESFDSSLPRLESLEELRLGSGVTKFLCFPLLERALLQVRTTVDERAAPSLLFPPHSTARDREKLETFVQRKELSLEKVPQEEKSAMLTWLVGKCDVHFRILNLKGQAALLSDPLHDWGEYLQPTECFRELRAVCLCDCELKVMPDLSGLDALETIDLSQNRIEELEETKLPGSVKMLRVELNPVEAFNSDLEPERLLSLEELHLGSGTTKFMCYPLLERLLSLKTVTIHDSASASLLYPSYSTAADPMRLNEFVEQKELTLEGVPAEEKVAMFRWLTETCGVRFSTLHLAGDKSLLREPGLQWGELWKPSHCFRDLKEICVRDCGIEVLPDLSHFSALETLDVSCNDIRDVSEQLFPTSVQTLLIHNNPIEAFNTDFSKLDHLKELRLGSADTRYLCLPLLRRIATHLVDASEPAVRVDPSSEPSLLYPPHPTLVEPETLENFICRKELTLTHVPDSLKVKTFQWLVEKCDARFRSLNLPGQKDVLRSAAVQWEELLKAPGCFRDLELLCLSDCGLASSPDLSNLAKLESVDLSFNGITAMDPDRLCASVKDLCVQGNPLRSVDVDQARFPGLRTLRAGSDSTRFVSSALMRLLHSGALDLRVPEQFRAALWLPSGVVFDSPDEHLPRYVRNPERYLPLLENVEKRTEAFNWLFTESKTRTETLDLASQSWLFEHPAVDLNLIDLSNIHTLVLKSCSLTDWPEFSGANTLKIVDLSDNAFESVPGNLDLTGVQTLDLSENPIEELDFEPHRFPNLTLLHFGSSASKYVSLRVLNLVRTRGLVLDVPEEHRPCLLLPGWATLASGPGAVMRYVRDATLRCDHIDDAAKRWAAVQWQVEKEEKVFTALNFSDQKEFCKLIGEDGLAWLFERLPLLTSIYLSNCGLESLPQWETLRNLSHADVSDNPLSAVSRSRSLKRVHVTNTDIDTLVFPAQDFPALDSVTAGSTALTFISFDLLHRVHSGHVSICISEAHLGALVFPPPLVLSSARDLDAYLRCPERYLRHVGGEDARLIRASEWLFSEADAEFTELDLSEMSELFRASADEQLLLGRNVRSTLQTLHIGFCGLSHIPSQISELHSLTTVCVIGNRLTDVSTFRHRNLKTLDVSENPVRRIDIDFGLCPQLGSLKAGSRETVALSLRVQRRVVDGSLTVTMSEAHRRNLVQPPARVVRDGFCRSEVQKYMEGGELDVTWYSPDVNPNERPSHALCEILSEDERRITTLKMNNQTEFLCAMGEDFADVLKHPTLAGVESLEMRNCDVERVLPLSELKHLRVVDLSSNSIASCVAEFCAAMETVESLTLRDCGLTQLPLHQNQINLRFLDVGSNGISSLNVTCVAENLEELVIDENDVGTVELDAEKFPALNHIVCGSDHTHFIAFDLVRRIVQGKTATDSHSETAADGGGEVSQESVALEGEQTSTRAAPDLSTEKTIAPLRVTVKTEFSRSLLLPPHHMMETGGDTLSQYLSRPETHLRAIEDVALREKALWWLLRNVPEFSSFSLDHQADLFVHLSFEKVETMLQSSECLKKITSLDLSFCELTLCPDISQLRSLESLTLTGNSIEALDEIEKCAGLRRLHLEGNPIPEFVSNTKLFENLDVLCIGPTDTGYISHPILERYQAGQLDLVITAEHQRHLVCPPAGVLGNKAQLKEYMDQPESCRGKVRDKDKLNALNWIVSKSQMSLSSLDLSERPELFGDESSLKRTLQCLSSATLSGVKVLKLSRCSLRSIPSLDHLTSLQTLDVSHNKITMFPLLKLSSLRTIDISWNPLERVDLDLSTLPLLRKIVCGSEATRFISFPVLYSLVPDETDFTLEVVHEHRPQLKFPSYDILTNKQALREFLKHPERELDKLPPEEREHQFLLSIERRENMNSLNLSGQADLCSNFEQLKSILNQPKLAAIQTLHLDDCMLARLPDLTGFSELTHISLDNNELTAIPFECLPTSLESISIVENDIKTIDFDFTSFPNLKRIGCGATFTRFIAFGVVRRILDESDFDVEVDERFREKLLMPTYPVLKSSMQLEEYVLQPDLNISNIPSNSDRNKALKWMLQEQEFKFDTSFSLSKLTFLTLDQMQKVLGLPVLTTIKELHLDSCGLTEVPQVAHLSHLKLLDLRNNVITDLEKALAGQTFEHVTELQLTGNSIATLDFDVKSLFPSLRDLKFGSGKTKYVKVSLLQQLVARGVHVVADGENNQAMIFPPVTLLNGTKNNQRELEKLCKNPEKALKLLKTVEQKASLFSWFLNDPKISWSSLELSGERELLRYHESRKQTPLIHHARLKNIDCLILRNCGLREFPDLRPFPYLKTLDLRDNRITDCSFWGEHKNLETLELSGNEIPVIDSDFSCFPALKQLLIGSKVTEYISMDLVRRMVANPFFSFKLDKSATEFRSSLKLPPASVLEEGHRTIAEYVKTPELFLTRIKDTTERAAALRWLVDNYAETFDAAFNLSNQLPLCDRLQGSGLEAIVQKLLRVKTLDLSGCGLESLPDLSPLTRLQKLKVGHNKLTQVPALGHLPVLTELGIEGNPIETIDISPMTSVTTLTCGQAGSWRIMPPTLRRVARDELSVAVPPAFQATLTFPPYDILNAGARALKARLDNEELDLKSVSETSDLAPYVSLVGSAEKPITAIRLSNVQCLTALAAKNDFQEFLALGKLRENVEQLYIDNCNVNDFPQSISLPKLTHVDLSNNNLTSGVQNLPASVTSLTAQNCGLVTLPNFPNLVTLDISGNSIETLSANSRFARLETLRIHDNKIATLDLDTSKFPVLKTLRFGSKYLRYISSRALLWRKEKRVRWEDAPESVESLFLPPARLLNTFELDTYLQNPETFLSNIPSGHVAAAVRWMLDDLPGYVKAFDLSRLKGVCDVLKPEGLQEALEHRNLAGVEVLNLSACGLKAAPRVDHMKNLRKLMLSFNEIRIFADSFKSGSLRFLNVEGNLMKKLDLKLSNFTELEAVTCGSKSMIEIAHDVVQKAASGSLNIEVPQEFKSYLKIPLYNTLKGDKRALNMYLTKGELDFRDFGRDVTYEVVKSMIDGQNAQIKSLKLEDQGAVFSSSHPVKEMLALPKLSNLQKLHLNSCLENAGDVPYFSNMLHLRNLHLSNNNLHVYYSLTAKLAHNSLTSLELSNCNLYWCPALTNFPLLKHFDFSHNTLKNGSYYDGAFRTDLKPPHPLETLNLSGNPIEEISIAMKSFPYLRQLTCGSDATHFISFALLAAAGQTQRSGARASLVINVPDSDVFKKTLLVPAAQMLGDPASLNKVVKNTNLDLRRIRDVNLRKKACSWLQKQDITFETLTLSGQEDFCTKIHMENFFSHPSLVNIGFLCLDRCGLKTIPLKSNYLPNMKELDVSHNQLTEICTTFKSHEKLEKLLVDGNPIETIQIQKIKGNFQKLHHIHAGSTCTKYIAMPLLEAVRDERLTVVIAPEYGRELVFPPYEVLKAGTHSLKIYMKEISASTKSNTDVWTSTTQNILMLLGNPEAGKTSLKRTLHANSSRLTEESDRTVILEREVVNLGKNISIATLDFGGHDIYELEYPIFLRGQNIIALIVIDLTIYDESNHDDMVTKWLHNCVLCAECKVIFVPTKREQIPAADVEKKVASMRRLISEWLEDEKAFLQEAKRDLKLSKGGVNRLSEEDYEEIDRSLRFFDQFEVNIIVISSLQMSGFDQLKEKIRGYVQNKPVRLSETWMKVLQYVDDNKSEVKYHINLSDVENFVLQKLEEDGLLKRLFSDTKAKEAKLRESVEECLRYLSQKGIILWYSQNRRFIYNKIDNVLELHKQLFRHDLRTSMNYKPNFLKYRPLIGNQTRFDMEKDMFLSTGLLSRDMLKCLWVDFGLSEDELESMIELIKANDHCFENEAHSDGTPFAASGGASSGLLRFPWFISTQTLPAGFWQNDWPSKVPPGYVELRYVYTFFRRLPSTLYERISVHLQHIVSSQDERQDWLDGVYVRKGTVKFLLQRHTGNTEDPQLSVQLRAPASDLIPLWRMCLDSYSRVVNKLVKQSTVVTFNKAFICPHCILKGRSNDDAHTLTPSVVMKSRCVDQIVALCLKPNRDGLTRASIPAAFTAPVYTGQFAAFHLCV